MRRSPGRILRALAAFPAMTIGRIGRCPSTVAAAVVLGLAAQVSGFAQPAPQPSAAQPPAQASAEAQTARRPPYQSNPANEDWSFLKDPATHTDV